MFVILKCQQAKRISILLYSVIRLFLLVQLNNSLHAKSLTHPLFAPEAIIISNETAPLNPFGCTLGDMVDFYKSELNIEQTRIMFFRRRMEDPRFYGYTQPARDKYIVTLAKGLEPSELRVVIAHELVHVRQFVEGSINIQIFEKEQKKDYLERSFEDEAFRLSEPMAIKFYQSLTCQKHISD
ncbi:MAG: hypothetical protein PUP46_05120 [Endozoicomonas sp. (ex Botrylloides leachii)]|nr:hypothetical protein [Endozoicomonas sp. (ex Botrylloides leachii)]